MKKSEKIKGRPLKVFVFLPATNYNSSGKDETREALCGLIKHEFEGKKWYLKVSPCG